jgi:NADPH:quinone reductase
MLFANVTLRLLGSDDFSPQAKQQAGADLTEAAKAGAVRFAIAAPHPLTEIAAAHDHVDNGPRDGRVLLRIPG